MLEVLEHVEGGAGRREEHHVGPRAASASGAKSWPLPLPPAIRITGSVKLSSALIVEATLVPLESL